MEAVPVLAYLDGGRRPYADAAAPLLDYLESSGAFSITRVRDPGRLADPGDHRVVLAATDGDPLGAEEEAALREFVFGGGGLVALHATASAWRDSAGFRDLSGGFAVGEVMPATELVVRAAEHVVTDRLDREFFVTDELPLGDNIPEDAERLLTCPWRFSDRVVAFTRRAGEGHFTYVGLASRAALSSPTVRQFLFRALRHAGGALGDGATHDMRVGLIGYGAIARDHGRQVRDVAGLELAGVADVSPDRRAEAEADFSVPTHHSPDGLLTDPGIDVVVVGTPPNTHAELVLRSLAFGKHVVCEKPFALRLSDVERMIAAAGDGDRVLTVYQSRRWDPDFVALRNVVASGSIGEPFHLESFIGGYGHPCSFWHSHEPVSGGTIFDWGSHYFDWTLLLFPDRVTSVTAVAQDPVWRDVTNNDHVVVDVRFANGGQAVFMHSDVAAALKPKWYLLATRGALVGEWRREALFARGNLGELVEDQLAPADSPALITVHRPNGEGGVSEERLALPARVANGFYRNLADHLLVGEPLAVQPSQARRNIAVMEAAARSIAAGGAVIPVDV